MNDRIPDWSAWKTPAPSPWFEARVWQQLEAARARPPAPAWWERWVLTGALAGATALFLVSLAYQPAASVSAFGPVGGSSLTHAYATVLKGN